MGAYLSMNIKRTLAYLRFLTKAKGRHGTHSPFVYSFVEKVMRGNTRFSLIYPSGNPGQFRRSTINRLGRTLQYLNPEIVYADRWLMSFILTLKIENPSFTFEVAPFPNKEAEYKNGGLIFSFGIDENLEHIKEIASRQYYTVIMTGIHFAIPFKNWQALSNEPVFKMVLDVWNFGLLSNHPDFKTKQYFRLR